LRRKGIEIILIFAAKLSKRTKNEENSDPFIAGCPRYFRYASLGTGKEIVHPC
jgi:hypothetical protein